MIKSIYHNFFLLSAASSPELELMSLCDELEAGLRRSQADSEKLMEAVLGKMLAW